MATLLTKPLRAIAQFVIKNLMSLYLCVKHVLLVMDNIPKKVTIFVLTVSNVINNCRILHNFINSSIKSTHNFYSSASMIIMLVLYLIFTINSLLFISFLSTNFINFIFILL